MLIAAAAFVIGAALGMGVLAASIVVFGLLAMHNRQPGISAFPIGHWTVLVIPVTFGAVLAWMAVRRVNRVQR